MRSNAPPGPWPIWLRRSTARPPTCASSPPPRVGTLTRGAQRLLVGQVQELGQRTRRLHPGDRPDRRVGRHHPERHRAVVSFIPVLNFLAPVLLGLAALASAVALVCTVMLALAGEASWTDVALALLSVGAVGLVEKGLRLAARAIPRGFKNVGSSNSSLAGYMTASPRRVSQIRGLSSKVARLPARVSALVRRLTSAERVTTTSR